MDRQYTIENKMHYTSKELCKSSSNNLINNHFKTIIASFKIMKNVVFFFRIKLVVLITFPPNISKKKIELETLLMVYKFNSTQSYLSH